MTETGLSRDRLIAKEKKERFSLIDFLLIFLLVFLIANVFVQSYWLAPVKVEGSSMKQTLNSGDWLYMDKLKEIERQDVVVFARNKNVNYIKRVIAIEGDELCSIDGKLYLKKSGESQFSPILDEHAYYQKEPHGTFKTVDNVYVDISPIKIGKGEIYVLGDNRWDSQDSRNIGLVKVESVLGVVPKWSIENKHVYAKYLNFVEKINLKLKELKED